MKKSEPKSKLGESVKLATMQDLHDKSGEIRYLLQVERQEILVIRFGKPAVLIQPYNGEEPKKDPETGEIDEKILGMKSFAKGHVDLIFVTRQQGRALLQYHGKFLGVIVPVPENIKELDKATIEKELVTRRV